MRPISAFPPARCRAVRYLLTDIDEVFGVALDAVRDETVFVGDSPNDAPMFAYFPTRSASPMSPISVAASMPSPPG